MRALNAEEIAALTKPRGRSAGNDRNAGRRAENASDSPECDHDWVPHTLLVTGLNRKEWPTKKCIKCEVWILLAEDEIVETITDMGDWLG